MSENSDTSNLTQRERCVDGGGGEFFDQRLSVGLVFHQAKRIVKVEMTLI